MMTSPSNKKIYQFEYKIYDKTGECFGVSVGQAMNNAKVRYLKDASNIRPDHYKFRSMMSMLKSAPITIRLDRKSVAHFRSLYRSAKDGDLLPSELNELDSLLQIITDKRVSK